MIDIKQYKQNGILCSDITLTRGDDATLTMPIYMVDTTGSRTHYAVDANDVVSVQVRQQPITGTGTAPAVVFSGTVTINSSDDPEWSISHTDSTIAAGTYFWDAQIETTASKDYTFHTGHLIIIPEVTTM